MRRTIHAFERALAASWPPAGWTDVTVLAAVSGGADSVALLRALVALKADFPGPGGVVVGHVNHGLRGAESDADQRFVAALADRLGVQCLAVCHSAGEVRERGDGLEAAARAARYAAFADLARQCGARFVVTAHTGDDQAETVLHRILRGTGVAGLAGIPRARPLACATVLRPMLGLRRREVLAYLADLKQPFREDASNAEPRHTRNRLRHRLLPQLAAEYNTGVVDALIHLSQLAGDVQSVIQQQVDDLAEAAIAPSAEGGVLVAAGPLRRQPPYLVRELFAHVWQRQSWPRQAMGFAEWDALAEMLLGCSAEPHAEIPEKRMFPGAIVAQQTPEGLRLRHASAPNRS